VHPLAFRQVRFIFSVYLSCLRDRISLTWPTWTEAPFSTWSCRLIGLPGLKLHSPPGLRLHLCRLQFECASPPSMEVIEQGWSGGDIITSTDGKSRRYSAVSDPNWITVTITVHLMTCSRLLATFHTPRIDENSRLEPLAKPRDLSYRISFS
jgi:hypothetical protein